MWSLFHQGGGDFLYCFRPYSAKLHYRHHSLDLTSGRKIPGGGLAFIQSLEQIPLSASFHKPKVLHLAFELGHLFHDQGELVPGHLPLAIEIDYLKARRVRLEELWSRVPRPPKLRFLQVPTWDEYQQAFQKVYEHLLRGDAYQVNLTALFYLMWKENHTPSDFIRHLWSDEARIGAYAHATWLSTMGKLLLSNSPECLVQRNVRARGIELYSMPIKGTRKFTPQDDFEEAWDALRSSKKEAGELNMITDLVRNDLSRIHRPRAQVHRAARPLRVPGLLHQYSLVGCDVPESVSWRRVLECLFPGGSISGAPKRRVLDIIHQVESESRGNYCGSTWLAYGKTLAASINIRTAELDMGLKEMRYGAGGGVTLKSRASDEFSEMMHKSESFLSPFLGGKFKS